MGKLEVGSIEPLLPSVARFGVVVLTVLEVSLAILAQLCAVVVNCAQSEQLGALTTLYTDCISKKSLLLGVSSEPLDNMG